MLPLLEMRTDTSELPIDQDINKTMELPIDEDINKTTILSSQISTGPSKKTHQHLKDDIASANDSSFVNDASSVNTSHGRSVNEPKE